MDFKRALAIYTKNQRMIADFTQDRRRYMKVVLLMYQIIIRSAFEIVLPERRLWRCVRSSEWFEKVVLYHFDDEDFKDNFRINRVTFFTICNFLRPFIGKKKVICNVISVERRLAVTLSKLGSSGELRNLANLFGIARSTVCVVVHDTTKAIVRHYKHQIKFPTGDELLTVTSSFLGMCGLPGVCGALDGTHIPIKAPSRNKRDYFNRKQYYSIVLQAVVDHQKKFINLNFGWPGSVHDARVFLNSELYTLGESGWFGNFHCELPGTVSTINPYLVADPAYPLKKWLMKPFSGNLSPDQMLYNRKISRCRISIEHAFGMLKGRWRESLKTSDTSLKYIKNNIIASCILHNICQDLQDEYLYKWDEDQGDQCNDPAVFPVLSSNDAKDLRNKLLTWCRFNPS